MLQIIAIYLLKTIVISGLLLLYYCAALRNKRFHYYNRFYLLATIVLSIFLPLLNMPLFTFNSSSDAAINLLNIMYADGEKDTVIASNTFIWNWQLIAEIAGIAITVSLLLLQFFRITKLYRLKRNYPVHSMQHFDFVNTDLQQAPFSFLKNIFWRNDISLEDTSGRLILQHEITHVQEKHTWDKLFIQLARAIFWMNPFYYFIQKELFLIHEFIADDKAVADKDAAAFADMLLRSKYGNYSFSPANHFSYSPIKRRLLMLTTSKKPSFSYVRRIMALPLLACTVLLFAFRLQKGNNANASTVVTRSNKNFTVIIDAGHGGTDAGAIGMDGMTEKDLTLKLAKKIKDLSAGYGINVILTRDNDVTMNPKERTDFAGANKADAFISVHVNAANPSDTRANSGMEVMVSKDNAHFNDSKLLGSAVVQKLSTNFSVNQNLIEPKTSVWVLKSNSLPSVLVEFGYIDNKSDALLLESDTKLDAMARNVLEGISVYARNPIATTNSNIIQTQDNYAIAVDSVAPAIAPLYIVDGKEVNASVAKALDNNKIKSVSVLKGKDAIDKYGNAGENGVVEITLKPEAKPVEINTVSDSVLYVIDGEITTKNALKNISPENIASVNVLKDETATKKYGEKGKYGVVEIILKNSSDNIRIKDATLPDTVDQHSKTFIQTQEPPQFPGGADAWLKHLQKDLNLKVLLSKQAPPGLYSVVVSFTVEEDGSIANVQALNDPGYGAAAEAVRFIKGGPNWIPAKQNGKTVSAITKQKITFKISQS